MFLEKPPGKGGNSIQRQAKKSILADTYEAVIAAVYLDSGFEASFTIVDRHFSSFISSTLLDETIHDFKSRLQELAQMAYKITPVYRVISETGPDHDKTFEVLLKIKDISATGIGKNKKSAEQSAAGKAFALLSERQQMS